MVYLNNYFAITSKRSWFILFVNTYLKPQSFKRYLVNSNVDVIVTRNPSDVNVVKNSSSGIILLVTWSSQIFNHFKLPIF